MENPADKVNRLPGEEECNQNDGSQKEEHQSGRTDLRTDPFAHIVSVPSARVEEGIFEQASEGKSQGDGKPDHQDRTSGKPFPQNEIVSLDEFHSCHNQEYNDEVSRNTETVVDQEFRQLGAPGSGIVLNTVPGFEQFSGIRMRQDALVVAPGKEERAESQQHIHAEDYEQQSEYKTRCLTFYGSYHFLGSFIFHPAQFIVCFFLHVFSFISL